MKLDEGVLDRFEDHGAISDSILIKILVIKVKPAVSVTYKLLILLIVKWYLMQVIISKYVFNICSSEVIMRISCLYN